MCKGLAPLRIVVWYCDGRRPWWRRRPKVEKIGCAATPEAWAELPCDDVQIVQILYDRIYKGKYLQEILAVKSSVGSGGADYYWWHPDTLWACGTAGQIPRDTLDTYIKNGREIDRFDFSEMLNAAHEGVKA